ncbi:hypothetical protein [Streptomyces sp. bgisy084]|uniref:hypothetical protein n=1 Tax=Streptomyces sp. bgisy084 TaxID=3413777 RepID=UPI003D71692A
MGMHRKIRVSRTRKWVSAAAVAGAFTAAFAASETAALADSKPDAIESPLSASSDTSGKYAGDGPYEDYPGPVGYFVEGKTGPVILALAKRLADIGYLAPDQASSTWGGTLQSAYQKWQEHLGYQGADANGMPDPASWAELKIPATDDASTSTTPPAPSTGQPEVTLGSLGPQDYVALLMGDRVADLLRS